MVSDWVGRKEVLVSLLNSGSWMAFEERIGGWGGRGRGTTARALRGTVEAHE